MDAEKRHQLKQNELAEALTHIKDYGRDPTTRMWLLVLVLILVAVIAYRVWGSVSASREASQWDRMMQAGVLAQDTPEDAISTLRDVAKGASNDGIEAAASLQLANLLRDQAETHPAQRDEYLNDSVKVLRAVVDKSGMPQEFVAAAAYSLATSYESLGDFAAAREMYEKIIEGNQFVGTPFKEAAQIRLDTLDELAEPVVFLPGEAPKENLTGPEATLAPTSAPTTAPSETPAAPEMPAEDTGAEPAASQPASGDAPTP